MKTQVTLFVEAGRYPYWHWARLGLPAGLPVIPYVEESLREAVSACETPYLAILPASTRVDAAFLVQGPACLDAYPDVPVLMGQSVLRSPRHIDVHHQGVSGLSKTRFLDPGNVANEYLLAQAPLLIGWQGLLFRTDALRQPRLDPLWTGPFPALGLFMALSLGSGLCLENRRVAVTLRDAEDPTEAACLARMPDLLCEIDALAARVHAAIGGAVPRPWAERVAGRLAEAAVQDANARLKAAREHVARADGRTLPGRVWLGATGLARRLMEQRLRRRYRHILENFSCP